MKRIGNRNCIVFLYSLYSYASTLIWLVLDLSPQVVRKLFFLVTLKKLGKNCMIDYKCFIRYPWRVSIGDNVAINRGCELFSSLNSSGGIICLEDHVVLGPKVIIFSAGHDYSSLDLPDISSKVIVDRYAWIGGNTTILPGVHIGEGAIIGAGSVVTKSIPAYSVAVGNPATVIKSRILKNSYDKKS